MADTSRHIPDDAEASPTRRPEHEALAVFLGDWTAEGLSYGSPHQDPDNPKGAPERWLSHHRAYWHTGEFFMIEDEKATTDGKIFDTIGLMGWDAVRGSYFIQSFENHGFERRYDMTVDGRVWTISGEHERARIEFSQDGRTQTIVWEWKPRTDWLPLCDRTARRVAHGQARA
jgi:hypothetical protein